MKMKGSTLIKKIQKAIDKHGDLPIRIDDDTLLYLKVRKTKSEDLNETNGKHYINVKVW